MAEVIPLRRIKTIAWRELAARFPSPSVEKAPPKERELRLHVPPSRFAGREQDVMDGFEAVKFAPRARRHGKLRLFRNFKLFEPHEDGPAPQYRPVAERLRVVRLLRRL